MSAIEHPPSYHSTTMYRPEEEANNTSVLTASSIATGTPGNNVNVNMLASVPRLQNPGRPLSAVIEDMTSIEEEDESVPLEVGVTKESLLQADETELMRNISCMADLIRGVPPSKTETKLDPDCDT